ncbi:alpha-xenorhabdolysin family binary toxin subunit A [Pseudomonas sp. TH39(2020)]|uniref:alpha-xenorhabdolysin family binary toxin subunit A n=1 Tax=Pseudomonas sp. TH39(2020) TaxID=2796349 RepID=UPI001914A7FA|nr:alpha-xenorhabdolysin family binary toxin subunit A [Pseudomonas sp. TH39(2020)]MBK5397687.1 alpha-xenorhabdolysin family binary toxin subunit A [Pseudomonas sp. TH39(2020)]
MSDNKLWDEALKDASPEQIMQYAAEAPGRLISASASDSNSEVRATGLLLTKKQIIDLHKYQATAFRLPRTLKDVTDYLRFGAGQNGGPGLFPEDFLTTFLNTQEHASRWTNLRERIMMTGTHLKTFAANMRIYSVSMEEIYTDVRAGNLLDLHDIRTLEQLRALKVALGDKFPGLQLQSDTLDELGYCLNNIFVEVNINLESTSKIKKELDEFGSDLQLKILPGIQLKVDLIKNNTLSAEIKAHQGKIEERSKEIELKNTEYKAAVQEALTAAAGMNIVGLAMAIYMGVEAEKVRAARNELYAQQDRDILKLASMNQTLGSLARVKHDLQSLEIVAIDAEIATKNLIYTWNLLHDAVANSSRAIANIHDALSLRQFITQFRLVANPWRKIETDADALIQVFEEAQEEFLRNSPMGARSMNVVKLFNSAYPPLDLAALSTHHQQMRNARTQANTWLVKLGYLPGLFSRFDSVVGEVGRGSTELQSAAQTSKYELETTQRGLEDYEKERLSGTDPLEIEEIDGDRERLLKQAADVIKKMSSKIDECLANISDSFDRRLVQTYLVDFAHDEQMAKDEINDLQSKLQALRDERKTISEAIAILAKAGIEELGKDIELTLSKVTQLGLAPPQIQLVMMAIDQLKKTLIDAGKTIAFIDMLRESDKLKLKIDAQVENIDVQNSIVQASLGRTKYLQAILSIEDARHEYAAVYSGAAEAYRQFLAATAAVPFADVEALSNAFKVQAPLFIKFLAPVSMPIR